MMHMEHRLAQTQSQQLVLTQKMQQALQILQMSGLELDQYVQQELETNPFLEAVQKEPEPAAETPKETVAVAQPEAALEESFDLDTFTDTWGIKHHEGQDLSINRDLDSRRQFYEDSITQGESLRAHLLTQLRMAVDNDADLAIGERIIIGDIDAKGYFTGNEAEIAAELGVDEASVRRVLAIIQKFEPTGVGAHDVVECLLLQIEAIHPENEELKTLVRDHLEELKQRQIPRIAKAMGVRPEHIEELKKQLATLDPFPGHQYASEPTQYVAPEIVVEKVEDRYIVRLANERLPEIRINDQFHQQIRAQKMSRDEKDYIRGKMESARWLQRNIAQRQNTIQRVGQAIVDYQEDFLEKGVEHIRPLTLQMIADQIGVHESTVARTTRGKYMQTPQGLFELKYFFSPGLKSDHGNDQSSKSVQAMVKKLIDEEDKQKPLSDQKIADLLKKEGINVARRTVTKYREGMGILPTPMRREYQ